MVDRGDPADRDRWVRLRFAIIGPLLAAPPARGDLQTTLRTLASRSWQHPITGQPTRFGLSTIQRWYSGRRMIEAMINGVRDPWKLAELAHHRIKATRKQLYDALDGRLTDHHRFMLRRHLRQYDALEDAIKEIDQQVDAAIARMDTEVAADQVTFRTLTNLLCTIPGVGELAAKTILAEIGTDMGRFPTAGHLLSWAGMCPGQNESAGKRKSSRLRKGSPWLKTLMVQCGWAASRKKDSYYKAQFNRLRGRHGAKKAICAVAASMLQSTTC
jgi:transposase